jgi:hypothetical protein
MHLRRNGLLTNSRVAGIDGQEKMALLFDFDFLFLSNKERLASLAMQLRDERSNRSRR